MSSLCHVRPTGRHRARSRPIKAPSPAASVAPSPTIAEPGSVLLADGAPLVRPHYSAHERRTRRALVVAPGGVVFR
ncbi:hypothetical protein GCM10027168_16280 [Streptomyces capparidis]